MTPAFIKKTFDRFDKPAQPPKTYLAAKKHPTLMVKDGILLSKDGKTLVAYPHTEEARVELPEGIKRIGRYAFPPSDCVQQIIVPEGVEVIEENAFMAQTALTSVSLPSTLKTIEDCAFEDCVSLEKVVLSSGMASLHNLFSFSMSLVSQWDVWLRPDFPRLETVIPPSVTEFSEDFWGGYDTRDSDEIFWAVQRNSPAYRFALENHIPYPALTIRWTQASRCLPSLYTQIQARRSRFARRWTPQPPSRLCPPAPWHASSGGTQTEPWSRPAIRSVT